jgi:adenine phosphoribosyltransferase
VPDFPSPGIVFRDITTLLADPVAWPRTIELMADLVGTLGVGRVDVVVGIESRGFLLGAPMSIALGTGFVPVRKRGRLPAATHSVGYELEYGVDELEIHRDALTPDSRVLLVDDLLATGGTAAAATRLVHASGATVAGCAFLIELKGLHGRERLGPETPVAALLVE